MTTESQWDKLLKIKTTGRDDSHAGQFYYPYEPTPYSVLERLAATGLIGKKNTLIDYGCGKGRVSFFLGHQVRCHCIGIEFDERIFNAAQKNKENAVSGEMVDLICAHAEACEVPTEADRFYFFNPFSVEILKKVIAKIRKSLDENPRKVLLFFYYPSDEYAYFLMEMCSWELTLADEIDCRDLFEGQDRREKCLVFRMG